MCEIRDLTINRYDKFPDQYQAAFQICLDTETAPEAVFKVLKLAQVLLYDGGRNLRWSVDGPHDMAGEPILNLYLTNETEKNFALKWGHIEITY